MSVTSYSYFVSTEDNLIHGIINFSNSSQSQITRRNNWLETATNFTIEQDYEDGVTDPSFKVAEELFRDDQSIVICEGTCRAKIKQTHKDRVKDARSTKQYGWLLCDTTPDAEGEHTYKSMFADGDNRDILTSSVTSVVINSAQITIEFPEIWVKTNTGVWYSIGESEVKPLYNSVMMTTQALFDTERLTQFLIDADYESDMTFADFKAKNYVTDADCFDDLLEAKTSDTSIFAQSEETPTAIG